MSQRGVAAIFLVILLMLLLVPMYYQTIDGQRVWYSLYEGIEMNIAENQWFWPSWN